MSLISSEDLITLEDARPLVPKRGGKSPHFSTLWRWAIKGIGGVKLETVRVGSTLCTSAPALRRFYAALAAPPPAKPTTDKQRQTARDRAAARLDAAGIK